MPDAQCAVILEWIDEEWPVWDGSVWQGPLPADVLALDLATITRTESHAESHITTIRQLADRECVSS
jgi:hypothetical protein